MTCDACIEGNHGDCEQGEESKEKPLHIDNPGTGYQMDESEVPEHEIRKVFDLAFFRAHGARGGS
jgi:hypothetical protein